MPASSPVPLPLAHLLDVGPAQQGVNALARQVVFIGEVLEHGRRLQVAGDTKRIAVLAGRIAAGLDQHRPFDVAPGPVGFQPAGCHAQVGSAVADIGLAGHHAFQHDFCLSAYQAT